MPDVCYALLAVDFVPDNVLIARESASFKSELGTVHSIPDNLRTLKKHEQSNEASNLKSCLPVPL